MRQRCLLVVIAGLTLSASLHVAAQSKGQVLGHDEGELLDLPIGPWIVKASPESGTQGAELHLLKAIPGFSTGLHVHFDKDEFFYIVEGQGKATIDEVETIIGKGDVLFIPKGYDHKVSNTERDQPLVLLFFLDHPGLADEAREFHQRFLDDPDYQQTLESLNEVASKYGTLYKTLD